MTKRKYTIEQLIQTDNDELVLAKVLKKTREFVLSHPEAPLTQKQYQEYKKSKSLLLKGMPLAYVLGYRWFFGNKFLVNPDVLIPRPETETLVELALILAKRDAPEAVVDVGTGSGAIAVSIASDVKGAKIFASDISQKALATAKKNAGNTLPKNKIVFLHGDLLAPFLKKYQRRSNLLLIANLPYLSKFEMQEPSIKFEPKLALLGGRAGTELIKKFIDQTAQANIKSSTILFEIGYSQSKDIAEYIKKSLRNTRIKIHKDLGNFERILEVKLK